MTTTMMIMYSKIDCDNDIRIHLHSGVTARWGWIFCNLIVTDYRQENNDDSKQFLPIHVETLC